MANDKYVLGKRSGSKQIVYHSYDYDGHTIVYRASVPYKEGAPKSYYVGLVDKKMNQLKAKGKLKKYNEAYIRKMVWLTRRKKVAIGIGVGALALAGIAVGVTFALTSYYQPSNVTFASKTLSIDHTNVTLHKDANFTFTVNEFYANYGYSLPDTINQVSVNGVDLTPDQYKYSNGHLNIGASHVTGKIFIAAEAKAVDFTTDSWSNIIGYANSGLNELHIRYGTNSLIGYEHPIQIDDPKYANADLKVRVIGEGHDHLATKMHKVDETGAAASLTFEFTSSFNADVDHNSFGTFLGELRDKMPIKSSINSVYKYTHGRNGSVSGNDTSMFLLSYREINGYDAISTGHIDEESCYEYYLDLDDTKLNEKRAKGARYWLRSSVDDSNAKYISATGVVGDIGNGEKMSVVPAFAIGKTKSFITDKWENVISSANLGLDNLKTKYARNSFVGLERDAELQDGSIKRVRVVGEDHDLISESKNRVAALTFEFVSPVVSSIQYTEINVALNNFFNDSLPAVLQNGIVSVEKKTVSYGVQIEIADKRIFPLSLREIGDVFFGSAEPYSLEEETYKYYRDDGRLNEESINLTNKKRNKTGRSYWLRSHYCLDNSNSHIVNENGRTFGIDGSIVNTIVRPTSTELDCYPAFSIGRSKMHTNFSNDTWDNVCYHAGFGIDHLKEFYDVDSFIGREREIEITLEGESVMCTVHVIGQNEDEAVDGSLAALTFEFTGCVGRTVYSDDDTKYPSFTASALRQCCNNDIFNLLPGTIRDSIKEVKKKTAAPVLDDEGQEYFVIEETTEKVFALSRNEISDTYQEGEKGLEYYKQENPTYSYYQQSKDMVRHKTGDYWLRTPSLDQGGVYSARLSLYVNSGGDMHVTRCTLPEGVAPAFAI